MNSRLANLLIIVLWLTFVGAFAGDTTNSVSQTSQNQQSPDTDITNRVYRLGPNDTVEVKVYLEPDLDAKGTIDEWGFIMLPLLGAVKIGGMTPAEAARHIQKLYEADYLVQANVNLSVTEYTKRYFTVLGQVQKPGVYEYPPLKTLNLFEALGMAGSFTRLGSPKVTVQRIENGVAKVYKIDTDLMLKNPRNQLFTILPDDIITVDEKFF